MAVKKEMTNYESVLYNEMKKLSKRANQRILRLERLTDATSPFSVKQLESKLSADTLNAWTKTGRVSLKKGLTPLQMKSINKALRQFLSPNSISTVKQAKEYTAKVSQKAGKKLSLKQASTYYKKKVDYEWIYQYIPESDFWAIANEGKKEKWNEEKFSDELLSIINVQRGIDEELINDIKSLYEYVIEGA